MIDIYDDVLMCVWSVHVSVGESKMVLVFFSLLCLLLLLS